MARLQLSYDFAHAAGTDAGNRSMRKAGRKVWNADDYNAAVKEMNRLLDELNAHPHSIEQLRQMIDSVIEVTP